MYKKREKLVLPEKLLIGRSDFYIFGKRALERIIIMGLLYNYGGYRHLSVREALEYIESKRCTTTRSGVNKAFKELIKNDWLTVANLQHYHPAHGQGYPYCLTEKGKQVYLDSNRFYSSISAYHNRKSLKITDCQQHPALPDCAGGSRNDTNSARTLLMGGPADKWSFENQSRIFSAMHPYCNNQICHKQLFCEKTAKAADAAQRRDLRALKISLLGKRGGALNSYTARQNKKKENT
ncbi:hypothetical protein CMI47_22390 [Candidatus Pacearchaeota archaeon]|nr:hypothetical protein [Candidatus Pacearchaeota archaeon]